MTPIQLRVMRDTGDSGNESAGDHGGNESAGDDGGNELTGNGCGVSDPQGSAPPPVVARDASNKQSQLARVRFSKRLLEVIGVRVYSGVVVDRISVFAGDLAQCIYYVNRKAPIYESPAQSQDMMDLALNGPYSAILGERSFFIEVKGTISGGDAFCVSKFLNPLSETVVYDKVLTQDIGSVVNLTFAVLSEAVGITVKVQLKLPKEQHVAGATARVHGEVTAHNELFLDNSVRLFNRARDQGMQVNVVDGLITISLRRSVVAAPLGSPLNLKVKLYADMVSFHEDLVFFSLDQYSTEIQSNGVVVQVSSPDIYTPRKQSAIPCQEKVRPAKVYLKFDLNVDDYGMFINDFRQELEGHDFPEEVSGHHVLAKHQAPGPPGRWMYLKIVAGSKTN